MNEPVNEKTNNISLDRIIPGRYAQITLQSGERLLISGSPEDLRIYKLGFLSLFNNLIYTFQTDFLKRVTEISLDPVSFVCFSITESDCVSILDIKSHCSKIENSI